MIFEYDELKECVEEDFERFYQMGFDQKQILPAVLNEYVHGEDFSQVENICIHIFLVLNYKKNQLNYDEILEKLKFLLNKNEEVVKEGLKNEYIKFIADFSEICNNMHQ